MKATAAAYANEVTVSREAFAQAFDAVAANSTANYLDFKMAALGTADNRAAFAAAFTQAEEAGFLGGLVAHLTALRYLNLSGLVDAAGMPAGAGALVLRPQDGSAYLFKPQGITPEMLKLIDIATMVRGLLEATRRVCMVEIDGVGNGTGFLVGPQTVLTNWHVVHTLIDPATGQALPNSASRLACSFDLVGAHRETRHAAVEPWLVEWSPMAVTAEQSRYPDMTKLKPGTPLDFCVIRVAGAPGRLRSWYDLKQAAAIPIVAPGNQQANARPFFVIQHPQRLTQHIAVAAGAVVKPGGNYQIQHKAPTLPGSSGGLCLDAAFNLVGLHQGEVVNAKTKKFITNIAISAVAISSRAPNAADVLPAYDVVWRLANTSAVIGRSRTLDTVSAMNAAGTPKPFLLIRGAPQSGKTFTRDLLEHRLEYRSRILVNFDGDKLPVTGRELAQTILNQAGSALAGDLPAPVGSGTTTIAWYAGEFMSVFSNRLREALPKDEQGRSSLVWLVIDRLTEETATPSDAMNFLHALFQAALPEIRFVLIGLKGNVPAVDPAKVEAENLPDPREPSKQEILTYLQCMFADLRIATQTDEIDRLAELTLATAKDLRGDERPLLLKVAAVLGQIVTPVWERWTQNR
ncbi:MULTISPECIES: serine protease [unclassified Mesorhizobium]|uniref:serine protease n=1 Tax=unclassified Mesorhizobium TaxID=325217 RepID=UPI0003CF39DC|nr:MULTISPECIES: serine protease [unclassified Mesorhizobium]ESX27617.1 hypothetical protein X765_20595 [Mesorhizobium sp. LSHC440B00]ESX30072.1 hypothetical protein X763_29580 [Mesorhizobium sp. LSHC432A00]ESX31227.1 hypothetical protein X764_30525 [Mesorhizobium sp. LSHC440A00]WJI57222.1 serine protease [Mesorhizobium sp. C432A]